MTEEKWRPVVGYEGQYEVSNFGRIRSFARGPARIMAPVLDDKGYPTIKLFLGGESKRFKIHRLVCRAFRGPPGLGETDVAHLDNDPSNPRLENLKWATRAENCSHKLLHGTHQAGAMHPRSRLTPDDVEAIRGSTATHAALAARYAVGEAAIRKIRNGSRWTPKDGRAAREDGHRPNHSMARRQDPQGLGPQGRQSGGATHRPNSGGMNTIGEG